MAKKATKHQQGDWQKADARVLGQILAAQNILFTLSDTTRIAEFYAQTLISIPGVTACRVCLGDRSAQSGKMESGVCEDCEAMRHMKAEGGTVFPCNSNFKCNLADDPDMRYVSIDSYENNFGCFTFKINDDVLFNAYHPFIKNLSGYIAITLENRLQKDLLQKAHDELERKVKERTHDLTAALESLTESRLAAVAMMQDAIEARKRAEQASADLKREVTERKKAEEAADRANQDWERTFNAISDLVMVLDDQHKIVRANKAMADALGIVEHELIGKLCFELVHGEKDPPVFCPHSRLLTDGQEHSAEVVEPRLGGIYDVRVSPLVDQNGRISGSVHVIRDITENKRAEEQIKHAEEFLNSVVDNLPDPVFAKSPQNGEFILWNKASESLFGFTKEEAIGKTDHDFFPKEYADFFWEKDRETFASGEVIDIPEEPVLTKNLGTRMLHTRKVPVYDKERQPFCLLAISQDITDRKRTENIMLTRLRLVEYATSHSLDELLQATLDEVEVLTDSLIGFYHFLEADQRTLTLQAWSTRTLREMCTVEGKGLHYKIDDAGVWVDCVHERKPVIHNDYSTLPHRKGVPVGHAEVIRELVVPVFRGDRIVAVLGVGNKPLDYDLSDIETVSLMADLAWDIAERKLAEDALRAASLYNRSLIEASLDPVVTISAEGKITDVNTAAERVTGHSRQDLLGTDFADYFTDSEKARAGYQEAFKAGSVIDYELEIRHKDGYLTPVIYNASVYYDHFGKLAGLFAAARNIAKQKRAEKALRDSEEQYRAVFNNAGIGIKVVNRDRRIIRANPALLNMLGYSETELLELAPVDVTYPDDREMTDRSLDAVLGDGPGSLRLEKRYIKKDGSVIWGDVSISTMRDAQGNRIAALEVIADITDKMKSQTALRESERRMRRIIDSSPVGIRITQDGKHVYANRALAKMLGYEDQEEILRLPAEALLAPDSRELFRQRDAGRMAGKTIAPHYEASGITRHGKTIALESWGTEIDYMGKKSWLAFIIDVSEAKSLKAQLLQAQKMEAIATLAGGIAHDFNNLLQVVLGYSDMLLFGKKPEDPEYKKLEVMRNAALDGSELAKGILAFSRRLEPNSRPINLNHEIDRVRKLLERTVSKMVRIKTILAENLHTVDADPVQTHQLLMNLAVNAQHAMPDGGLLTIETANVTLDEDYCRTHLEVQPGEYVMLAVSDTGHGMDEEVKQRIFEPFFTTKPQDEGTGLGLAIVYGIVKQHSGHVACHSEPGVGTTFKIYLPALAQELEAGVSVTQEMPASGTDTILLVDDELRIRELGREMLQTAGYTVVEARNGQEAVDTYKKRMSEIALVILDLIMPIMGGKECLEELLKINPKVQVVIASGYSVNGLTQAAIETGARGFVNKPYKIKDLLRTVRKLLDESP